MENPVNINWNIKDAMETMELKHVRLIGIGGSQRDSRTEIKNLTKEN